MRVPITVRKVGNHSANSPNAQVHCRATLQLCHAHEYLQHHGGTVLVLNVSVDPLHQGCIKDAPRTGTLAWRKAVRLVAEIKGVDHLRSPSNIIRRLLTTSDQGIFLRDPRVRKPRSISLDGFPAALASACRPDSRCTGRPWLPNRQAKLRPCSIGRSDSEAELHLCLQPLSRMASASFSSTNFTPCKEFSVCRASSLSSFRLRREAVGTFYHVERRNPQIKLLQIEGGPDSIVCCSYSGGNLVLPNFQPGATITFSVELTFGFNFGFVAPQTCTCSCGDPAGGKGDPHLRGTHIQTGSMRICPACTRLTRSLPRRLRWVLLRLQTVSMTEFIFLVDAPVFYDSAT